jgi:hypothetical protein
MCVPPHLGQLKGEEYGREAPRRRRKFVRLRSKFSKAFPPAESLNIFLPGFMPFSGI